MDAQQIAAFQDETEELRRDLAERQERRAAGLEPVQWPAPEPEVRATAPAGAITKEDATRIVQAAIGPLRKELMDTLKEMMRHLGAEFGASEKLQKALVTKLREEIPQIMKHHFPGAIAEEVGKLRKEVADNKRNEVADVVRQKGNLEAFKVDIGKDLLRVEREVLELRKLIAEKRD